ncbi:hypothetical protein [Herpetosiphon geysericola]|uniref:Uncharacterized protein n=1 Tax=Herpetosiphon geysericola TaxID=70996 RepID=A0A0P6YJK6_9CHLR|nr:hypothetical protein [Herpetosiphon geysericola]KPL90771.1 hypothetical protein SE18_05235 [Herpetosiphon geysericola]
MIDLAPIYTALAMPNVAMLVSHHGTVTMVQITHESADSVTIDRYELGTSTELQKVVDYAASLGYVDSSTQTAIERYIATIAEQSRELAQLRLQVDGLRRALDAAEQSRVEVDRVTIRHESITTVAYMQAPDQPITDSTDAHAPDELRNQHGSASRDRFFYCICGKRFNGRGGLNIHVGQMNRHAQRAEDQRRLAELGEPEMIAELHLAPAPELIVIDERPQHWPERTMKLIGDDSEPMPPIPTIPQLPTEIRRSRINPPPHLRKDDAA